MSDGVRIAIVVFGLLAGGTAMALAVWAIVLSNRALRTLKEIDRDAS